MKACDFTIRLLAIGAALALGGSAFAKAGSSKSSSKAKTESSLQELKWVEGDERGNEVKALKAELMVSHAEQQAVEQVEKLIRKHKGTSLEAGLQMRLAEMYMRTSKTERFFEIHRQSDTVVSLAPLRVKSASSKQAIQKAIAAYSYLEKQFPQFHQMDLVVFNQAFARQVLSDDKGAEELYWRLIRQYPKSVLVPEAHLAIGELSFDRGQFPHALEHFNAVKKYPRSRVYPYSLYKAAWTYYNMHDGKAAMDKLEEVVEFGRMVRKNKIDARLDLRKEALIDMTLFYEDVYPSKDAFQYFRAQAGEMDVSPSIVRLSEIYERHSRYDDQRELLSQFIEEMPKSEILPDVYVSLIQALDQMKRLDSSVVRLNELYELCQPASAWSRQFQTKNGDASSQPANCVQTMNSTALTLAKRWLKSWKKTQGESIFADSSEKAFEIYLRTPASTEEYHQAHFSYAELLFQRGKFRPASNEYFSVAQSSAPANLAHDAAYASILSLEKAVGEKWSDEDEKRFHELASFYIGKNPKGPYRLDIEFKMALLAYEKSRYDEAAPIFLRLGREFAAKDKGMKAQDLYLDILNIKKDYKAVREYALTLSNATPDPVRSDKLRKLYEGAYFLDIQSLEEKDDLRAALKEYLSFARQNPNSTLTEKAIWNAMQLQYKLGDEFEGAQTGEEYASKFPRAEQTINALLRAAQTYEQMAQVGPAARVLSHLSELDEKSKSKWKELAADFYTLDGQFESARSLYQDLKAGAQGQSLVDLVTKIEALEKNYGTPATHQEALRQVVELGIQPQAGEGKAASVEALFENGQLTEAFNEGRRLLGTNSPLNSSQRARVRFVQARILEQEFLKQSVKSRAEKAAMVLAIKTEKLEKAQEAFQSAIKYNDPRVTVQALERLYNCYAHYVTALKSMPTPVGLSVNEATAFREELQKLVVPLEEKSVDTLNSAVAFAKKQQFLDGTVQRLESELEKVNMRTMVSSAPDLKLPGLVVPVLNEVGS